jgi:hypothetical protein
MRNRIPAMSMRPNTPAPTPTPALKFIVCVIFLPDIDVTVAEAFAEAFPVFKAPKEEEVVVCEVVNAGV